MSDNSAKVLSLTIVWASTCLTFIFGVFDFNWNGPVGALLMFVVAVGICTAAGYATSAICKSFEQAKPQAGREGNNQASH